jgi:hypothetical protein
MEALFAIVLRVVAWVTAELGIVAGMTAILRIVGVGSRCSRAIIIHVLRLNMANDAGIEAHGLVGIHRGFEITPSHQVTHLGRRCPHQRRTRSESISSRLSTRPFGRVVSVLHV